VRVRVPPDELVQRLFSRPLQSHVSVIAASDPAVH